MRFFVSTPIYCRYYYQTGGEEGADVVEIESSSKSKAKAIGLRELRRTQSMWVRDMDGDKRNPFSQLKVYEVDLNDQI